MTILASIGLSTDEVHASELTPAARLRKLSLSLRGVLPSQREYTDVMSVGPGALRSYFEGKTQEYVRSEKFGQKLANRVYDDFRLGLRISSPFYSAVNEYPAGRDQVVNRELAAGDLVNVLYQRSELMALASRHFVGKNPSWNEFLSSKDLNYYVTLSNAIFSLTKNADVIRDQITRLQQEFGVDERTAAEWTFGERTMPGTRAMAVARLELNEIARELSVPEAMETSKSETVRQNLLERRLALVQRSGEITPERGSDLTRRLNQTRMALLDNLRVYRVRVYPGTVMDRAADLNLKILKVLESPSKSGIIALGEEISAAYDNRSVIGKLAPLFGNPAFSNRFMDTRYSKSAAFYRIFFCDEMRPVALGVGAVDEDILGRINRDAIVKTPGQPPAERAEAPDESEAERHVSKPCVTCHRKLDKAQAMIDGEPAINLVYDDETGTERRVDIPSPDQFIPIVQQQDAYVSCQTRKFWNWIVGENATPTLESVSELRNLFRRTNGDVRAVVTYLTSIRDFYDDDATKKTVSLISVRPILNRCNGCHMNKADLPSFTHFPIVRSPISASSDQAEHLGWLRRIVSATALNRTGRDAKMPPRSSNWILTFRDFTLLAKWIQDGAASDAGAATIDRGTAKDLLADADPDLMASLQTDGSVPTFYFTWRRYFEHLDLNGVLSEFLPSAKECFRDDNLGPALGFKDKVSGDPDSRQPTAGFLTFLDGCVRSQSDGPADIAGTRGRFLARVGFGEISKMANLKPDGTLDLVVSWFTGTSSLKTRWESLTSAQRAAAVEVVANRLIGQGVLRPEEMRHLVAEETAVLNEVGSRLRDLETAIYELALSIMMRDEFLSF